MPAPNRAQSWHDCDPDIRRHVEDMVKALRDLLSPDLTGVYLHGSLAMGSFYRPKSDIDVLVVVPMPYQVHYSEEWHDRIVAGEVDYAADGTDLDLIAHVTHLVQRGVTLHGAPHLEVFGVPPWSAYLDAVMADFRWLLDDEHVAETPYYAVLSICRTLQLMSGNERRVRSKDEGGEWGLNNLPREHHALIGLALAAYRSGAPVTVERSHFGTVAWDAQQLLAFRDYARSRLTA